MNQSRKDSQAELIAALRHYTARVEAAWRLYDMVRAARIEPGDTQFELRAARNEAYRALEVVEAEKAAFVERHAKELRPSSFQLSEAQFLALAHDECRTDGCGMVYVQDMPYCGMTVWRIHRMPIGWGVNPEHGDAREFYALDWSASVVVPMLSAQDEESALILRVGQHPAEQPYFDELSSAREVER